MAAKQSASLGSYKSSEPFQFEYNDNTRKTYFDHFILNCDKLGWGEQRLSTEVNHYFQVQRISLLSFKVK